jgi:hypothetical protein
MSSDKSPKINEHIMFIYKHWRRIFDYAPDSIYIFNLAPGRIEGLCTHLDNIDYSWIHSRGGKSFKDADVPESFFWVGIQNRGGSEYLFLMWNRDGRKFWFYDQYVVFMPGRPDTTKKNTRIKLDFALKKWDSSKDDVIFSGPWGWLDQSGEAFEHIIKIRNHDYWIIVVDMLQQNWAVIERSGNGVMIYFFGDTGGVFDQIKFESKEDAENALKGNGFRRYDKVPEFQKFIARPTPPFRIRKHPNGAIYSSGRFWRWI